MWRIGKLQPVEAGGTPRRAGGARGALTISWPVWARRSKPRWVTVSSRRSDSGTGQPWCQKPRCFSCALTGSGSGSIEDWNGASASTSAETAASGDHAVHCTAALRGQVPQNVR